MLVAGGLLHGLSRFTVRRPVVHVLQERAILFIESGRTDPLNPVQTHEALKCSFSLRVRIQPLSPVFRIKLH